MAPAAYLASMPVKNAKDAAVIARDYVEKTLSRSDLLVDEVKLQKNKWVVTLEGLAQHYELRIDAKSREVEQLRRV